MFELQKYKKTARKVDSLAEKMKKLTDEELRMKTDEFKERLEKGETLNSILPEAFAVCREADERVLGLRPFFVQIVGGIVLHHGDIAEMKTGEGKTLVATMPVYLNALTGKGVHVVTVNDYLAKRDANQMGKVYRFLGLTVGCITGESTPEDRKEAYNCDVTYGTNTEFGFDYLRDNMATDIDECVQRELNYAIVDEVDSILVDEARTPLIISGAGDEDVSNYTNADKFVKVRVREGDYAIDEKTKQIALTDSGVKKMEKFFGIKNISDPENLALNHYVNQAIRANFIMQKDVDYIVRDDEILIVDEFTGRIMNGRRFSNGLHQAIEAKEYVSVGSESKTLATITIQNFFRMYQKLSGMTGTAKTEEEEFMEIYNMRVIVVPTNRPVVRKDNEDIVYATEEVKYDAIVEKIKEIHKTGQPILVGTTSVEKSEIISDRLKKAGIPHNVLNAKNHEQEAMIIAQAGHSDSVTIATNMAGRGTDIVLGGNPDDLYNPDPDAEEETPEQIKAKKERLKCACEVDKQKVLELGGLFIIGTERHESRRIDNQLRGRSGRQGDPGETVFFVSLEDDLMKRFGGDKMKAMLSRLGADKDPIHSKSLTKSIRSAQKKIEGQNFASRKYVLQYDDVVNKQRHVIYTERQKILKQGDMKETVLEMIRSTTSGIANAITEEHKYPEEWDYEALNSALQEFCVLLPEYNMDKNLTAEELAEIVSRDAVQLYEDKEKKIKPELLRGVEREIMLQIIDMNWMEHIDAMDQLKEGIGLRAIGQMDPALEYAKEGFELFERMLKEIKHDTAYYCINIEDIRE